MIDFRIRPAATGVSGDPTADIGDDGARYVSLYGDDITVDRSVEALVADMSSNDVFGIVQAEYEEGDPRFFNRTVAGMLGDHPERFLGGIATADPRQSDALDTLVEAHEELGLKGWVFQPGFLGVRATDPRCFPLYEYCQDRGVPVTIHTGINFSRTGPIEFGRPTDVDVVACSFPDLILVCNHGGWPWVMETVAVLWKHENVYADFGAISPKYMADSRGGWGPIAHWMNTQISSKVLFASDWPMMRYERVISELPLLELKPESFAAYTHGNAARLIEKVWAVEAPAA